MQDIYVFLSDGSEECEALIMVDLFRRAKLPVHTVAVPAEDWDQDHHPKMIVSSHQVPILCDLALDEVPKDHKGILCLPGGLPGVDHLLANKTLEALVQDQMASDRHMVAICAGPSVLGRWGFLKGKDATVYPGFQDKLLDANYRNEGVVEDGKLITGRALGSAIPMTLTIIQRLLGDQAAKEVAKGIVYTEWA